MRDDLSALRRALEKQAVVLGDGTDADVVAFAEDELEAAVQVFHVRGGRVRGQRGWIVEKPSGPSDPGDSVEAQLVEQFLTQFYGDQAELGGAADESTNPVPREVLVPCLPPKGAARSRMPKLLTSKATQFAGTSEPEPSTRIAELSAASDCLPTETLPN